jgi:hypothetical protein
VAKVGHFFGFGAVSKIYSIQLISGYTLQCSQPLSACSDSIGRLEAADRVAPFPLLSGSHWASTMIEQIPLNYNSFIKLLLWLFTIYK